MTLLAKLDLDLWGRQVDKGNKRATLLLGDMIGDLVNDCWADIY